MLVGFIARLWQAWAVCKLLPKLGCGPREHGPRAPFFREHDIDIVSWAPALAIIIQGGIAACGRQTSQRSLACNIPTRVRNTYGGQLQTSRCQKPPMFLFLEQEEGEERVIIHLYAGH